MNDAVGSDPFLGKQISGYTILSRLGAGGMGVVYKAHDDKLDRTVALKFLPDHTTESDAKRRFLREARAAAALDHPNIGVVHGIDETPQGDLYIVMTYYDGETLAQRLSRGSLSPVQAVEITHSLALALAEARRQGLVHRDIKPANIMLTRSGMVKLLDFGLARLPDSETLTHSGQAPGTPAYMAPERALGDKGDHRSDLWSLGVVLYEMLAGRRPFVRNSSASTLMAIVNDPPPPLPPGDKSLEAIVYRLLAKDPEQRYQDASQLVAALAPLRQLDSAPTETAATVDLARAKASASGQPSPKPKPAWRRPALAVAALLLAASAWFTSTRLPAEKHIVVLPFTAVGDNAADASIRDGILETLTSRLSNLERLQSSLWVAPASEVRRRSVTDAASAQRVFGANIVVNGSVQRLREGVRLTLNLIDANSLRQLGSAVIDDKSSDFASLQDKAVAQLARLLAVEIRPENLPAAKGEAAPAHAYEAYLKGLSFLQRADKPGNLDAAIQLFESAVKTDARFALAFTRLAEAQFIKSQSTSDAALLAAALENGNRAAAINSQLAPVHVTLGRIYAGTGKHDLAAQEFQRAIEADPRSPEAYQGIAKTYEAQGRPEDAEASLQKAVALRPTYWEGHNNLGAFYYRRAKYADAAARFRRVIELTPDNASAYINLGVMLNNLKDTAGAIAAYEKSISIAPHYAAYSNLAVLYYNQANYAKSAETYEKALKMNDRDYRPWGGLASARSAGGQAELARPAYERAIQLGEESLVKNPTDATLLSYLATYYAKLGNHATALDRIQTALALAPEAPNVLYEAALVHESAGRRPKALPFIRAAVERGYPVNAITSDPDARSLIPYLPSKGSAQ